MRRRRASPLDTSRVRHVTRITLHAQITAALPELRAFARFLIRDRTAADDLVQDTLVRALGALDQFAASTNMRAWLFAILRNTFYEQARRRRTERRALEATRPESSATAHQEAEAELGDLERQLWALPAILREALILVGAQGMSYEEAAIVCNVPLGTMKARISRARARIARVMGREITDTPEPAGPD
ncbi:MAG: sigma-70 family RNA polymerase sigma factor [Acetobacteraceae bacterium]|nr:sigma-70 family RNA polymerase sigma factor [Acetobacteraceae bacterium]